MREPAKKRHVGKTPCEARVIPMMERGMRACGITPTSLLWGRHLCARHAGVQKKRAALAGAKHGERKP